MSCPRSELAEGRDRTHQRPQKEMSLTLRRRVDCRARLSRIEMAIHLDVQTSKNVSVPIVEIFRPRADFESFLYDPRLWWAIVEHATRVCTRRTSASPHVQLSSYGRARRIGAYRVFLPTGAFQVSTLEKLRKLSPCKSFFFLRNKAAAQQLITGV